MSTRQLLVSAFQAAVNAADPFHTLQRFLPTLDELASYRRVVVIGAGKAGGSMAAALEAALPPDFALSGLVVTRYGHAVPTRKIAVVEAAHPVPDGAALQAAQDIVRLVSSLEPEDLLIALISGGGSSLLTLPVPGVSLQDLQDLTAQLLKSGAPIEEMNVVRKHLSQVQGGRLAQLCQAKTLALVISDVAGDDLSAIASGPFAPDTSTFSDAINVLNRWGIKPCLAIESYLLRGVRGEISDTPKSGDVVFERVKHALIATAHKSLESAANVFSQAGYRAIILGDTITGEARDVAQVMAGLTREVLQHGAPFEAPVVLLSGGECTVTLRPNANAQAAKARGGRCSEFLLSFIASLGPNNRVTAIAADTDGIDGSETNAGVILDDDTWSRARQLSLNPREFLDWNDSYGFFEPLAGLVHTGPTFTNVNDFRAILIAAPTV